MKSEKEAVKPVKNGSHTTVPVTTTKAKEIAPVIPGPFSFLRKVTDDFERQLAAWGIESPFFYRPLNSWLMPKIEPIETALWTPQVEIEQRSGNFIVRADVPGAVKDDLDIEIVEDRLVLKGERRREEKEEREGYFRTERYYGSFYRAVPLPEGVDVDSAKAEFKDGVLEITMKAPEVKTNGKKIEIS
jgi:HSP20 family protein